MVSSKEDEQNIEAEEAPEDEDEIEVVEEAEEDPEDEEKGFWRDMRLFRLDRLFDADEIEVVEEANEETGDVVPPLQLEHVEVSLLRHPIVEYDITVRICGCPLGFLNYLRPFIAKFLLNPVSDLIHFPRKLILAKNQQ